MAVESLRLLNLRSGTRASARPHAPASLRPPARAESRVPSPLCQPLPPPIPPALTGCSRSILSVKGAMNVELLIGMVGLAVVAWHESSWWKRRQWQRTTGEVVDVSEMRKKGKVTYFPIIKFPCSGVDREFTSKYGSSMKPEVPSPAIVILSPDGRTAEHYSNSNRWMLTLIPLVMALAFLIKGVLSLQG